MCGISGIYHYGSLEPVAPETLEQMLGAIIHRGPDDSGVLLDGNLGIGMRRLSIIDLGGGHQPIYNEDESIGVVFNGEIYNYQELAAHLRARGHVLRTASDTEVLVHLYEEYGDACVEWLRGMFGFAIWDSKARRLLVARDHVGVKPLYFMHHDGRLIFSSEIKSILRYPGVRANLNLVALSHFLSLRYVPAPETIFEGIHALEPGHLMTCDANGVQIRRYWDIPFAAEQQAEYSEEEYAAQLEALLHESVRMQMMSDVPFGAFLSGGIDSSTIVALMSQYTNEPVKTFCVGFTGDGAEDSELPYARMVATQYETDHHEVMISGQDMVNLAGKIVWHLDQPIGDFATIANYMVADLASQHVKMVLTGEGGDELFAGYARYVGERFAPAMKRIPAFARNAALAASRLVPGMRRAKVGLFALSQTDEIERMTNWFPLFNRDQKAALMSQTFEAATRHSPTQAVFARQFANTPATDQLSRMLYVDTKLWLPDDLLARGDKTTMACSLEGRVPLLDHKLVEFAARVPSNLKIKGMTRKYLLRKVASKYLPREIIDRKKKGFPLPMAHWLRGEARGFMRDLLSPDVMRRRDLFEPTYVERLMSEHESGFADHSVLLWGVLNVELWHQAFIDTPTVPQTVVPPQATGILR